MLHTFRDTKNTEESALDEGAGITDEMLAEMDDGLEDEDEEEMNDDTSTEKDGEGEDEEDEDEESLADEEEDDTDYDSFDDVDHL